MQVLKSFTIFFDDTALDVVEEEEEEEEEEKKEKVKPVLN